MLFDIITIGSATRDVFMRSKHIRIIQDDSYSTGEAECFALGSKIDVDDILFETGGGATNTAVGFRRQGFRTAFVGRIGYDDGRGREILRELQKEGVDASLVVRDRHHMTAYSVLLLTERGERTVLIYRGASAHFHTQELPLTRMRAQWFFLTAVGGNLSVVASLLRHAKKIGASVAWNPGAAEIASNRQRLLAILRHVDAVFLNREEAVQLAGTRNADSSVAVRKIAGLLPGLLIVTDGAHGAIVGTKQTLYKSGNHRIRVVDTTGAGDAFGCGFIGELIRSKGNIRRSMQFATANAESVLQHIGAKEGLLHRWPARNGVPVTLLRT